MTFISYAQNYEDVMLARALQGVEQGFYIDVGAQDPVNDSVTKALYLRGWHGINIEPVTYWFERLQADRPRDINLQLAVSDGPGSLHLFEVVGSGLSTTDTSFAHRHAEAGHQIRESDVQCVTLDSLCQEYQVDCVHFLKIDCEGAEAAALRGLSLQRIRPWIILLEATEPNSQTPAYEEWEPLLIERGYHFVYQDGLNRYYVADERRELDESFLYPPNVFDHFVRAPEANAREELGVLRSEAAALRHNVEHLQGENYRREEALVEQRRALTDAHLELRRLHEQVHLRELEISRLLRRVNAIHRSTSWRITYPLRWAQRFAKRMAMMGLRVGYPVLRWPARGARPLLRWAARAPWVRAAAARLVGRESMLGRHGRLFLFGGPPDTERDLAGSPGTGTPPLTHHATQILDEIQEARAARGSGKDPFGGV
jgi:FkbM family methyltransferase